jgi:hypothetical protein
MINQIPNTFGGTVEQNTGVGNRGPMPGLAAGNGGQQAYPPYTPAPYAPLPYRGGQGIAPGALQTGFANQQKPPVPNGPTGIQNGPMPMPIPMQPNWAANHPNWLENHPNWEQNHPNFAQNHPGMLSPLQRALGVLGSTPGMQQRPPVAAGPTGIRNAPMPMPIPLPFSGRG